jgi:hypothetical protein
LPRGRGRKPCHVCIAWNGCTTPIHVIALNRSAHDGLLREGNWNDGLD